MPFNPVPPASQSSSAPTLSQLVRDATPEELIQAAALNHVSWFRDNAVVAGGEVWRAGGVTVIHSPASEAGAPGEVILAFPQMNADSAGDVINDALDTARRTGARQALCWSLWPTQPADLGARLVARGFEWAWRPHWMALDLSQTPAADFPVPNGLKIRLDDESAWDVDDLPYYDRADAARLQAHARQTPRRAYHFGAWLDDELIGHSLLHISSGPLGVGGLYNVSVLPKARGQGVGRAVSRAACEYARALGCRYVLLNAATHIYERLGFVSLGQGQTWWLHQAALDAPPPTPGVVAFTEAVGRGDTAALDALPSNALPADLDGALLCQMTPLEVAARLQQPKAAEWLLRRGASPDVIPLCDLGWRDRLPALLADRPDLANRRLGAMGVTPLHEAVNRNNAELARLLLSAHPDLTMEDTQFHATPLGWAQHFGHDEIARLIEAQISASSRGAAG